MAKTRLSRTELNMNDIQQPEDEEMTIDLLELFRSLLKNIKLIVVLTVVLVFVVLCSPNFLLHQPILLPLRFI